MKNPTQDQTGFLKKLFSSMPCGVLVLDKEKRILPLNNVPERTGRIQGAPSDGGRDQGAFNCANASKGLCGGAKACGDCRLRRTALEAVEENRTRRRLAHVPMTAMDGGTEDLMFQVTAAPFDYEGGRLAVITMEHLKGPGSAGCSPVTGNGFAGITGRHEVMRELFRTIMDVAPVDVPVLIQGESGTGKELAASAIHNQGPRADMPFVPVNCAALPQGVLESELFGHVKGAFTGALRDKKGRFELAHGGTLFLDEVADIPMSVQVKLLRVLQEGEFERVGDEKTVKVDVRIISAANCDLRRRMEKGLFRKDLFYRINVVPLHMPPLRERRGDIPLLVEEIMKQASNQGLKAGPVSRDALEVMKYYPWPGNVRELQSAIRFALVKSGGETMGTEHLPTELRDWASARTGRGPSRKLDKKKRACGPHRERGKQGTGGPASGGGPRHPLPLPQPSAGDGMILNSNKKDLYSHHAKLARLRRIQAATGLSVFFE
jgi:DNA-binding NtrC family response regulator